MTAAEVDPTLNVQAAALHERAIVVDALGWAYVERSSAIEDGRDQIDRAVAAGLTASNQYLASHDADDLLSALNRFWRYYGLIEARGEHALIVETVDDLLRAKREGKLGLILGFQGASPITTDLAHLSIFWKLGLRIMGLCYDRRNRLGDGCQEPHDQGLTAFGRVAVKECNRLGIVVDCSHTGRRTSLDAIEVSSKPVVFSHSNADALTPHQRNITDEQIDAIRQSNGVIGISTQSAFTRRGPGRPTIEDMLAHIDYVVQKIGIDYVGIGTDMVTADTLSETIFAATYVSIVNPGFHKFAGQERFVEGFDTVEGFQSLTLELLRRGYSEDDVLKVLGGNWLRVFREVWR